MKIKKLFQYISIDRNLGLINQKSCLTFFLIRISNLALSVLFGFGFLIYPKCLAGYLDADWAGCIDDRKSTLGGCFYLGNNLVSWMSKKQNSVSLSTAEVEYIAAASCCA